MTELIWNQGVWDGVQRVWEEQKGTGMQNVVCGIEEIMGKYVETIVLLPL